MSKKSEIDYPLKINEKRLEVLYNKPFYKGNFVNTARLLIDFALFLTRLTLKTDDLLLDLGCGSGWTTDWFTRLGVNTIGLDISRHKIKIAKERTKQCQFIVGDAENLPFKNNSFTKINCYDSLHHMPNWKIAVTEAFRVLTTGGGIVFLEPGSEHHDVEKSIEYGILERGISSMALKNQCKKVGFKTTNIRSPITDVYGSQKGGLLKDIKVYNPIKVFKNAYRRTFVVAIK